MLRGQALSGYKDPELPLMRLIQKNEQRIEIFFECQSSHGQGVTGSEGISDCHV